MVLHERRQHNIAFTERYAIGAPVYGLGGVAHENEGAIREVGALRSGELSGSAYLENRLFDAAEGAADLAVEMHRA